MRLSGQFQIFFKKKFSRTPQAKINEQNKIKRTKKQRRQQFFTRKNFYDNENRLFLLVAKLFHYFCNEFANQSLHMRLDDCRLDI